RHRGRARSGAVGAPAPRGHELHRRGRRDPTGPHRRRPRRRHLAGLDGERGARRARRRPRLGPADRLAAVRGPPVPRRRGVPRTAVPTTTELKRQIGLYAATAITVGNIIGSGIFRSPHSVAQELPGFTPVLLAWVLGGVLSICGSLVLTELAVRHPKTGG